MDIKYEKCRMDEADLTLYEDSISTEDSLLEKSQMQPARKRAGLGPYTRILVVHACYIVVYSSIAFILAHYLSRKYHGPGLIYCESAKLLPACNIQELIQKQHQQERQLSMKFIAAWMTTIMRRHTLAYRAPSWTKRGWISYNASVQLSSIV